MQLGAEACYYVMINAPMTCLNLNRLQRSDGRTWNKHPIKQHILEYFELFLYFLSESCFEVVWEYFCRVLTICFQDPSQTFESSLLFISVWKIFPKVQKKLWKKSSAHFHQYRAWVTRRQCYKNFVSPFCVKSEYIL